MRCYLRCYLTLPPCHLAPAPTVAYLSLRVVPAPANPAALAAAVVAAARALAATAKRLTAATLTAAALTATTLTATVHRAAPRCPSRRRGDLPARWVHPCGSADRLPAPLRVGARGASTARLPTHASSVSLRARTDPTYICVRLCPTHTRRDGLFTRCNFLSIPQSVALYLDPGAIFHRNHGA